MKKLLITISVILLVIILLVFLRNNFGGDDSEFELIHEGLIRNYKVHVPADYDGGELPMVIYLHGGGGNMNAAYLDGLDEMSDKHGFILAVPEGTGEFKFGNIRASWNGGEWETGECCGDADDVGFISKMIEEIENNFEINSEKIYVTGISNGGLMANRLGCELADKISAIATIAPAGLMSNCNPTKTISVMNIHGTEDPINPVDGSEPSVNLFNTSYKRMNPYQIVDKWKKINNCSNVSIKSYENAGAKCITYNECVNNSEVELCIIDGMGHTYPSGAQYLPKSIVGPVSKNISFDQIWKFFEEN